MSNVSDITRLITTSSEVYSVLRFHGNTGDAQAAQLADHLAGSIVLFRSSFPEPSAKLPEVESDDARPDCTRTGNHLSDGRGMCRFGCSETVAQ